MIRALVFPILRHIVAVVLGFVFAGLVEGGAVMPDFNETVSALTLVLYAVIEKLLKPMWRVIFREKQPGDTPPPTQTASSLS